MDQVQIINVRLQAFREAASLANANTKTTYSYGAHNLSPIADLKKILNDAEAIYNFLTKTNGN